MSASNALSKYKQSVKTKILKYININADRALQILGLEQYSDTDNSITAML